MKNIKVDLLVDANGLSCPMPIVKLKKGMAQLEDGQVVELQSTDKGSMADVKAWANNTGYQYLGSLQDEGVFKHYIRKDSSNENIEKKHEVTITNDELINKIEANEDIQIVDVREEAEYAFAHIPNAISMPIGDLEDNISKLSKDKEVYVICRTGNRSDLASQMLSKNGFNNVINVIPGMSKWIGNIEGIN